MGQETTLWPFKLSNLQSFLVYWACSESHDNCAGDRFARRCSAGSDIQDAKKGQYYNFGSIW
jgi:hypothetical protein